MNSNFLQYLLIPVLVYGSKNSYDYIIVGGGISGLSQMEFIDYNEPQSTKLLIEQHDRVGGRAFSLNVSYNGETVTFEHGAAMRHSWNDWFYKLASYLSICDDFVKMDTSTNNARKERLFRNIHKNDSLSDGTYFTEVVYNWRPTDFFPLNDVVLEFYAENNNGLGPQNITQMFDCLDNWTLRGQKLNKYNHYAIYKNIFNASMEYIHTIKNSQYPPFLDNSFASRGYICQYENYFPWKTGRPTDVDGGQWTFKSGYNLMTQRLYEKLDGSNNNEFNFNEEVVSIHYKHRRKGKGGRKYIVTTRNFNDFADIKEYKTDNVVLAIPPMNLRKILKNIDPFCEVMGRKNKICYKTKQIIEELVVKSKNDVEFAYKQNLIYDNYWEWVERINITDYIQSTTDLDIRSIYIDDNWRDNNLFAIQMYSRRDQAQQLHYLQQSVGDDFYEFAPNVIVSHFGNTDVKYTPSSKQQVSSVIKELADLLSLDSTDPLLSNPIAAFGHSFGLNETGMDGIYIWSVGTTKERVINDILQPLDEENIYIISVDYSRAVADHGGAIYAAVQNTVENLDMINPLQNVTHCATL